jgi:hypothetical protein
LDTDTQEILDEKMARKVRLITALNSYPAFATVLDDFQDGPNYELAMEVLSLVEGDPNLDFTQEDFELVSGIIVEPT